jgi:hypothetical protein
MLTLGQVRREENLSGQTFSGKPKEGWISDMAQGVT